MVDQVIDPREEPPEPGESFALTTEGWQRVPYAAPEGDWRPMEDGAYESPDGLLRSWPADPPTGG
jgi:hypothetical protein